MTTEKAVRRSPRLGTRVTAEVWQGGSRWLGIFTVLGATGGLMETDTAVDVGTTLGLRFTVPGSETTIVCGAVVRDQQLGPAGVGLEFVFAPGDGERLAAAIDVATRP